MILSRALPAAAACIIALASSTLAQDGQSMRGMVLPGKQVLLNAPVDGTVATIGVEEGQHVKADALLVQMDARIQQAVVAAAELRAGSNAELERAKLELEEANVTLDRMTEAFEQHAAREWEVRRAKLRRDIAAISVEAARETRQVAAAELKLESERLDRFKLVAPWDGVVTRVPAEEGATLSRSDPVVQLVSLAELKANIYLPAELQPKVEVGRTYRLTASAPVGRVIEGKLTFADAVIDPASQAFRCVFTIDNADGKLPAGFAVELVLE